MLSGVAGRGPHSFVLIHMSLSRLIVSDVPRRSPTWAPIEFYAAISAMDTVEDCMGRLADGGISLSGWRLFSQPMRWKDDNIVQGVTGFEPLFIRGEAVAYARTAIGEEFRVLKDPRVLSRFQVPAELISLLGGCD